jgi:ferredoxin-NADP reductase
VPRDADFYLCGPGAFMRDLAAGLLSWGVPPTRLHQEPFGPSDASTPGTTGPSRPPHLPAGTPGSGPLVSFARSHLDVRGTVRSGASWSLPRLATSPCGGPAGREHAIRATCLSG